MSPPKASRNPEKNGPLPKERYTGATSDSDPAPQFATVEEWLSAMPGSIPAPLRAAIEAMVKAAGG